MATHLTLLDFSELSGIRLSCRKCGAAVSFQFRSRMRFPAQCPGCGGDWESSGTERAVATAKQAVDAIGTWSRFAAEPELPFDLQFEVAETEEPDEDMGEK